MKKTAAYNIVMSVDSLTLAGYTDVDFAIEPEFEEVIVKDSEGDPDLLHTGNSPVRFTVSGIVEILDEVGEDATHISIEDFRELVDDGDALDFVYGDKATAGKVAYGTLIVLKLNEKSGPSGTASWSIDCESAVPAYSARDSMGD